MKILDATCGFRGIWFQKNHPFVTFMDKRNEVVDSKTKGVKFKSRRRWKIKPDVVSEWKNAPFPDEYFDMIIFDPPHKIVNTKRELGAIEKEYGCFYGNGWKKEIKEGVDKLFKILKPEGVFVFKWSDSNIDVNKILKLFPYKPMFGSNTKSKGHTANFWIVFIKYRLESSLELL